MRGYKYILFILTLFVSVSMQGQYNPTNPAEPGANYTLTLQATPSGAGSFNINTVTTYSEGTNVSLRAYTNSNFIFAGWELNGEVVSTSSSFTYTMPAKNVKLIAHYRYDPANPSEPTEPDLPVYSTLYISSSPSDGGYANVSSGNKYEVGTSVSLKAYNYSNFLFKNWTENGEIISTSSSFNYVMKEGNPRLVANYAYSPSSPGEPSDPLLYRKLTLNCNPSSAGYFNVSSGNEYQESTTVYLLAYSNQWYSFKNWTLGDSVISTNSSFYYLMPESDVTLTANYSYNYNPSNPSDPNEPAGDNNIYGMTESGVRGQTIAYPIYLENSIETYGMLVDVQFPAGFILDTEDIRLSGRAAGHDIDVESLGDNNYRFSLSGTEAFNGDNGKVFDLLVTIPDTATMGMNYPVKLTHGVMCDTTGAQTVVPVRCGYVYVEKLSEDGLYSKFSYDKLQGRVKFSNLSSGKAMSYVWDFGDGMTSTEESPLHVYSQSGQYTVRLTAKGEADTDVAEMVVLINDESTWSADGTFILSEKVTGVRHFTSAAELLDFINKSKITGSIRMAVEAGKSFGLSLTDYNIATWNNILSTLSSNGYTFTFGKYGSGRNPIFNFGEKNTPIDNAFVNNAIANSKALRCDGVELQWWGIGFNPASIHNLHNQTIHSGEKTAEVDFSPISADLKFEWTLAEIPNGVSGTVANGERTIPTMTIINEGEGNCNLTYNIVATYNGLPFCNFTNVITVTPALVGLFSNLSPANETVSESTTITLSWNSITNAVYDVYIWNAKNQRPADPVISGTSNLQYTSKNFCQNGHSYKWQIVARNESQELASDTMCFSVRNLPDLHVYALDCSEAVAGSKFTVQWTVRNDGIGSTGSVQWNDYIWLVTDVYGGTTPSGESTNNSRLLATVKNMKALESGESYTNSIDITLEERIYGNYYVIVASDMYNVANIAWSALGGSVMNPYTPSQDGSTYKHLYASTNSSYNKLSEQGETNTYSDNFFYKKIEIAVPDLADLQIPSITSFVIPNKEPVLAPAQAAARATGAIAGGTSTNPDDFLMTWEESYIPTPLTAAGLRKSNAYYSGKKIAVKVKVANKGGENTKKSFRTVLYLSSSPDRDAAPLTTIGSATCNNNIPAGKDTVLTFVCYLPYELYGDVYFHAYADIADAVYELANTVNNWGVSNNVNVLLCPGADFVPKDLTVPTSISSSSTFDISYKVSNKGTGIPYTNRWKDRIYMSKKSTGLDNTAVLLSTVDRAGYFLSPTIMGSPGAPVLFKPEEYSYNGDDYRNSVTVKPTDLTSGTYYIYVVVDADADVYEHDGEGNNIICSKAIKFAQPDLTAEFISISEDTLSTGKTVALTWKLKNSGSSDIQDAKIKDSFYATVNQDGSNGQLLSTVENTVWIAAGSEKTLRANITVPSNSSFDGLRYIYVKTNTDNAVNEESSSNNVSSVIKSWFKYESEPVVATPTYRGPSLNVDNLNVNKTMTPGEQTTISYVLRNTGDTDLGDIEVAQEVYLSNEHTFSASNATKCVVTTQNGSSKGLRAGRAVSVSLTFTVPDNIVGGDKYLYVFADRNNEIGDKQMKDNCITSKVGVIGNLADLVVTDYQLVDTIMTSVNTTLKFKTSNLGEWNAGASNTRVYLSSDATYSRNDIELSSVNVASILKGGAVENTAVLNVADKNDGKWYVLIVTDESEKISELNEANNLVAIPVTVKQSPLPDLSVTELSTDEVLTSGQSISIKTTIQNVGENATRSNKWSDTYYLSQNSVLNTGTAVKLGSKVHVGILGVDGRYTNEVSFQIPPSLQGNYMLFVVTDAAGAITEVDENNNSKRIPVYVNGSADTPADLIVTDIDVSSTIKAGEDVTISYNLANIGEYSASGTINDVIYLSDDDKWDIDDEMVGVVNGKITVHPGNTVKRTVTGRITNMPEGEYYVVVKTNSTRTIAEKDYDNNADVTASTSSLRFNTITLGNSASVLTSGYYRLEIPSGSDGKTVGLYLNHPANATVGLYAAYENVPTTAKYDISSSALEGNQQEVLIPNVKVGNYYILAQDNAALVKSTGNVFKEETDGTSVSTSMTLSAQEIHFGATTLSISQGGSGGWVSTDVNGALFDSIMDFRLKLDEKVIPAEMVTYNGMTKSRVTFNLNDAETGSYDVVSELPDGTLATLPNGFKVVPGTSVGLGAKIDAPGIVRVGSYAPISVSYANGGNTDIEIYRLMLVLDNGYLGTSIKDLERHQSVLYLDLKAESNSRGYTSIPPGEQRTINLFMYQTTNLSNLTIYVVK